MLKFALPFAALALAGCTAAASTSTQTASAATEPRVLQGRVVGSPIDCVTTRDIQDTDAVTDRVILFHMRNGTTYRNDLPDNCPNLSRQSTAFSHRTTGDRLCSIDTIDLFGTTQGISYGSCRLGKFAQYELPEGMTRNSR